MGPSSSFLSDVAVVPPRRPSSPALLSSLVKTHRHKLYYSQLIVVCRGRLISVSCVFNKEKSFELLSRYHVISLKLLPQLRNERLVAILLVSQVEIGRFFNTYRISL